LLPRLPRFRKERGKDGAPFAICDLDLQSEWLGHPPTRLEYHPLIPLLFLWLRLDTRYVLYEFSYRVEQIIVRE